MYHVLDIGHGRVVFVWWCWWWGLLFVVRDVVGVGVEDLFDLMKRLSFNETGDFGTELMRERVNLKMAPC